MSIKLKNEIKRLQNELDEAKEEIKRWKKLYLGESNIQELKGRKKK